MAILVPIRRPYEPTVALVPSSGFRQRLAVGALSGKLTLAALGRVLVLSYWARSPTGAVLLVDGGASASITRS